jgi:hypothetical protein
VERCGPTGTAPADRPFLGLGGLLEVRRLGATLTIKNPSGRVRRVLDLVLIEGIEGIEIV